MPRHAYMIMAHADFRLLENLLVLLDDDLNDIYVHVDVRAADCDFGRLQGLVRRSELHFTERIAVNWGGYSQIACEILLLRTATENPHRYYHLLSGADLPLVPQSEIHEFFERHDGEEFVHFAQMSDRSFLPRVTKRHLLTERRQPTSRRLTRIGAGILDRLYVGAQSALHTNSFASAQMQPMYGAQWFSITDELARYVLQSSTWIERTFARSFCGDEIFLQTLVYNSRFKNSLHVASFDDDFRACARRIDWTRGAPYVWRSEDHEELLRSANDGYLFARKFSTSIDAGIAERIFEMLR